MTDTGFLPVVRRWWWVLLLAAIVGGVAAYLVSDSLERRYEAEARLLVGPVNASGPTIEAAGNLGRTYAELAKSRPVVEAALSATGQSGDPVALVEDGQIAATANEISRLVTIDVERGDPRQAAELANALGDEIVERADAAPIEQRDAMQDFRNSAELQVLGPRRRARITDAAERTLAEAMIGSVQTVDPAVAPAEASWPRRGLLTGMGAAAGLLLAATFVFLRSSSRRGPGDEALERSDGTFLGTVTAPRTARSGAALAVEARPESDDAERYRVLAAKAVGLGGRRGARSLVVVDSGDESTSGVVAGNVAAAMTEAGRRVVLVDAAVDGGATRLFGLEGRPGYADVDADRPAAQLDGLIVERDEGYAVLPRGQRDARRLMGHDRLHAIMDALRERADVVLVSTPPVDRTPAALEWAEVADASIVVVDDRDDAADGLGEALRALSSGAGSVGTVLARRRRRLRPRPQVATR